MSSSPGITRKGWGSSHISSLLTPLTSTIPPSLSPDLNPLPTPFTVLILGASRGIGTGIATAYTKAGATSILLSSRRLSGLETTAEKCRSLNPNINLHIHPCDITSAPSVSSLASAAVSFFPNSHIDVVVINSGYSGPVRTSLLSTDPETFLEAAKVNYVGTFHAAKYLIPLLLASEGGAKAFVAVSTLGATLVRGVIANTQYCVSKLAQLKLMEHVHEQFGAQGVKAYSVHPGAVETEMAVETAPEEFKPFLVDDEELCGAVMVWLTRDEKRAWLSGRFISANWNLDKLEGLRERIVEEDLLKVDIGVPVVSPES